MARASTTCDAFGAIGEPRRREILEILARRGERVVGELVEELGIAQPSVSKHLAVLRDVGLVSAARRGRERVYRLEPKELRAVYHWAREFERLWEHQLDRIKQRAEAQAALKEASERAARRTDER